MQQYITSHGLALNCNTDLAWFNHIVPCGIHGKGVTSITDCLGKDINVEVVLEKFLRTFEEVFKFPSNGVEFLSDQLDVANKFKIIAGCKLNTDDVLSSETNV